jgi:hypothetical protein
MRQKRGVEGRSKRGANSDFARESEVVSVTSKVFIEFNGKSAVETVNI